MSKQITNAGTMQTAKIKTYVVGKAGVSPHNGGPIKSPPETPQYDSAVMYWALRGPSIGTP